MRLWQLAVRRLRPWGAGSRTARVTAVLVDLTIVCALLGINVGYAIYGGLLIATAVLIRGAWRDPEGTRGAWRGLPVAVRAVASTLILPLWIWFLSPHPVHPKEILAFLHNRDTGPPLGSLASILYYPRVFVLDYAPGRLGEVILALFGVALVRGIFLGRRLPEPERVLLLAAGLSILLPTLHPYKEPRFLATAIPFVLLAAAMLASRVAHALPAPRLRAVVGAAVCIALAGGIVAGARAADLPARLAADDLLYSADPAYRRPLDFIAAAGRGAGRLGVIGAFNELSENLIRCRLAQSGGPEVTRPLGRFRADLPPPAVQAELRDWLRDERPGRIVALRPLPGSPLLQSSDYRTYNAWQLAAIAGLESDSGVRVAARQTFAEAQVEVVIFASLPR